MVQLDISGIEHLVKSKNQITEYLEEYQFEDNRTLRVIGRGFPINFLLNNSVCVEVMDLILSCAFLYIIKLITGNYKPNIYTFDEEEEEISLLWTKLYT